MLEKIAKNATLLDKMINVFVVIWIMLLFITTKGLFTLITAREDLFIVGETLFNQVLNVTGGYTWVGGDQNIDVTFFQRAGDIKIATIITQIITIINLCVLFVPLYFLKKVLSPMITANPFELGISENIKSCGCYIALFQVFDSFSTGFAQVLCKIFIEGYNRGSNFQLKPEIWYTLFIFTTMTAIFKYGEELQLQYDETI